MKGIATLFNDFFGGNSYKENKKSAARIAKNYTFGGVRNKLFRERQDQQKRQNNRSVFFLIIVGVVGIAAGCLILFVDPYDILFKLKIKLNAGGEFFELWKTPPVELYLKVYIFNVTNREAFLAGKEKLKVQEIGPYVYREYMEHSNITFNSNGTMTSIPLHPLRWVPEMSNGKEDDKVIVPNVALLSFADYVMQTFAITRMAANLVIHTTDSHPLVEMTAKEFMFGYSSSLVTIGNTLLPNWIKFNKVGLVDRMYDFDGDVSTFYTGENSLTLSGVLATYNRSPKLPQWDLPCGIVKDSSDGTKFPSLIKHNDTLLFFRKSLCRAMPLVRSGNVTYKSGLKAYEYHFIKNALDNGMFIEENKCFCRKNKCLPRGLIDVTDCYYGFPIALSYPHFLDADPKILDKVEGCHPDPKKHQTFFIIQPETGLPLEVSVRMQINMALNNIGRMSRVDKFADMILPLLWTEIGMYGLPPNLQQLFSMYINILPKVQEIAIYFFFAGGAAFVFIAIIKLFRMKPVDDMESFNAKYPQEKTLKSDEFELEKKTKSPIFNSKDVISEIIDEGKQVIFGKKQHKVKYEPVYKDTVRRRSSLTGLFSLLTRKDSLTNRKYDAKDATTRETAPLRPSTDSETESSSEKEKTGNPFNGEDNMNFSEAEEALKRILEPERRRSCGDEVNDTSDEKEDFQIDISMLDNIKEERI